MKRGTIIFDKDLNTIGKEAFKDCENLTSITIPKKVNSILASAFQNCINLNEINYNGSSSDFKNIKFEANWDDNTPAEFVHCSDTSVRIKHNYLTFTALEDNSSIGLAKLSTNQTLEYSTDAFVWNTFDISTDISLNIGDKVYIRGILSADNKYNDYTKFEMIGKIAASGNCNALWNYQDLNAPLKQRCGYHMFWECRSLTTAPELPATTLATECYGNMFYMCTSLTTAPELPATELARSCYNGMFHSCTSLTTAPELPATTLVDHCYQNMFYNCTKLNYIKCLAVNKSASYCTGTWMSYVSSTGTFVKHPNATWSTGNSGTPSGWTVEDATV